MHLSWRLCYVGCRDLTEQLFNRYDSYDPHDLQDLITSVGLKWTDPMIALETCGYTAIRAKSHGALTDTDIRRYW